MKKIRRTRIRTETSRLVFIQKQSGRPDELVDAHEFCPACGQKLPAPVTDRAALPARCPEIHDESNRAGVPEIEKQKE